MIRPTRSRNISWNSCGSVLMNIAKYTISSCVSIAVLSSSPYASWMSCRNSDSGSGAVMVYSLFGGMPTVTCATLAECQIAIYINENKLYYTRMIQIVCVPVSVAPANRWQPWPDLRLFCPAYRPCDAPDPIASVGRPSRTDPSATYERSPLDPPLTFLQTKKMYLHQFFQALNDWYFVRQFD